MSHTLAIVGDRKTSIREYAKSLAKTDKRLQFNELAVTMGLERGSDEHRQAHSVYCASRNAELMAYVEKARSLGMSLDSIRETTDKETGTVKSYSFTMNSPKVPKVRTPKIKQEDILKSLASLPKADLQALLAKLS